MKKQIRINFTDFWSDLVKDDNLFYNLLSEEYDVIIDEKNPEYVFFSILGPGQHMNYRNAIKIMFYGENVGPNWNACHYAMGYDYSNQSNHYRLPLYILNGGYYELPNKKVDEKLLDRKFCNFVVSNPNCRIRNDFFMKLSKYKKVDSGGRFLNNIGQPTSDKLDFISQYKFSIAFENDAYREQRFGYTTEKILQPMKVNSIPLYWGNPIIGAEFNTKSFVNYHDFNNMDDMIEYIIHLDNNDDEYMKMLNEPWLNGNRIVEELKLENIKKFLTKIIK